MPYRGPLDWLNFFLADVRGALGPYIGIYLLTEQHWNQVAIGFLATVAGIVGLVLQAPVGAFIDATRWKRAAVVAGVGALTASALVIAVMPTFPVVLTAQTMMAVAGAVFGPAIAAITLGILGSHGLAYRMGRNAAFDHAGNVSIAVLAGTVGWWFSQSAVFYLVPVCSLLAAAAVLSIPARAIDHARARGLDRSQPDSAERPSSWSVLVTSKPSLVFAACVALFHFANAPMLPLVGQKLALAHKGAETALMSACIVAAQLVMLPMALLVGTKADAWGRKPIFLAAFAILPIRGVLYTLSDDREWLVAVQLLDGVGAGVFGVLAPLLVADLMRGTGRYNVSLGAVATVQGIGASLSNTVAGMIVVQAGYSTAFLTLAAVAAVAFATFLFAMPETGMPQSAEPAAGTPRIKFPVPGQRRRRRIVAGAYKPMWSKPIIDWVHAGPSVIAAFLASLVEFGEALTVVLAVGIVRGWRPALTGACLAYAVLLALIVVFGPMLQAVPLNFVQLLVGTLLLLFGMRWLRKAILRSAGVIPLHYEEAVFASETRSLRQSGPVAVSGWDATAIAASFKIVMLEGIEVVFVVVAIGATSGSLVPPAIGAGIALVAVVLLGVVLHRPLAVIPENALKFAVGVLLCAFGTFWTGEGIGIAWPGEDWSILALIAGFLVAAGSRSAVPGTSSALPQSRRRDMHTLTKILREFVSLFVDDGTLAATILIWVAFYGLLLQLLPIGSWQGPILFIGLAVILIENVRRSARSPYG